MMNRSHGAFRALVRDFGSFPKYKGKLLEFIIGFKLISSAFKNQSRLVWSSRKKMQATSAIKNFLVAMLRKLKKKKKGENEF